MAERKDGVLTSLLLAFCDFAQPVLDAFASPEAMEFFWYRHGWRLSLDEAAMAQLNQVLPDGLGGQELERLADAVRQQVTSDPPGGPALDDVARLADAVARLAEALAALSPSSLAGLTGPLGEASTWEDLGEQLFDSLLEQYLQAYHPIMYLVLLVSGCLRYEPSPAVPPARVAFVRAVFDWSQLQALLHDPVAALARTYHWGDPSTPFDHERLLDAFGRVLRALRVETHLVNPGIQLEPGLPADAAAKVWTSVDALRATVLQGVALHEHVTYEVGFDLLPAGPADGAAPSGLILRPRLIGAATESIPLGASFVLTATADASAGDVLGVSFFPGDTSLTGGDVTVGTAVEIAASSTDPWYLVGTAGSARIEVHSPSMRLSLQGTAEDAELRLRLATAGQPGARVVIPMGGSDAFVQDAVGKEDIQLSFSPEVIWSSATGFAFNGRPTPRIDLPLSIKVGSFTLKNATIALVDAPSADGKPGFALQVGLDIGGSIGPVAAVVQGIGFAVGLVPYSREDLLALPPGADRPALGNLDVDLRFAPPTGAGLIVDAADISGGGFLGRDPVSGRYSGVLDLHLQKIGITAVGLIDTKLPAGHGDYALLLALRATFPAVQIGFGFALTGVGGLLALNRRVDVDALRGRLAAGTAGRILAPQDPVRNAPALLADLDTVFPITPGITIVGPTVQLLWAGLVHLDVGVFVELPGPARVVLLGSAHAEIERDGRAYLSIRVDVVGVADLRAETAAFDAVLIDSHLMGTLDLTGGAAFRLSWGGQPYAVLSLGGFNPAYHPEPLSFPATLAPVAMVHGKPGDELYLRFEGYFAITSNTLQFGASVEALIRSGHFVVHGTVGFDALIQFVPFHFQFDIRASVNLTYRGHTLAGLTLTGSLTGPGPVVLHAKVCIELLFFDICYSGTFTLGPSTPPPVPAAADLLDTLLAELANPARLRAAGAPDPHVRLQPPDPSLTMPVVAPTGTLAWEQQRAPLGLLLTRVGGTPLPAPAQVSASAPSSTQVSDWFAPGQFTDLTDDQALTRPAFERLTSGLQLAGTGAVDGPSTQHTLTTRQVRLPANAITPAIPVIMFPAWIVTSAADPATPAVAVRTESWIVTSPAGERSDLTGAQARQLATLTASARAIPAADQLAALAF